MDVPLTNQRMEIQSTNESLEGVMNKLDTGWSLCPEGCQYDEARFDINLTSRYML